MSSFIRKLQGGNLEVFKVSHATTSQHPPLIYATFPSIFHYHFDKPFQGIHH